MDTSGRHSLFGTSGDLFAPVLDRIAEDVIGAEYRFMDVEQFARLLAADQPESARVYWSEMLFRAHWAASSNILRHRRWFQGCIRLCEEQPNFLGFAACLRGFVEASADAVHSLGPVPLTLADNYRAIAEALAGKATRIELSPKLEDKLIHFQFARKLQKGESAPSSHQVATVDTYLRSADAPTESRMKTLYSELCQMVHPAAHSLLWMSIASEDSVRLSSGDDKAWIEGFCKRHVKAIERLQMQSINISILVLKVLNRFRLIGLVSQFVESLDMGDVPGWLKIKRALAKS
jgi:hypothetical protein